MTNSLSRLPRLTKISFFYASQDKLCIKDKRIQALLSKGPKYRLPSLIDFDTCQNHISKALINYSWKWCRREHAELDALSYWKKSIMDIIDTRISFHTSNNHNLDLTFVI